MDKLFTQHELRKTLGGLLEYDVLVTQNLVQDEDLTRIKLSNGDEISYTLMSLAFDKDAVKNIGMDDSINKELFIGFVMMCYHNNRTDDIIIGDMNYDDLEQFGLTGTIPDRLVGGGLKDNWVRAEFLKQYSALLRREVQRPDIATYEGIKFVINRNIKIIKKIIQNIVGNTEVQ